MANRPSIKVEGLREVKKQIRRMDDEVSRDMLKEAHRKLAEEVVRDAERNVPVRTGRLKASLRPSGTVSAAAGKVGSRALRYAPVIHWGWPARGIERRPFLLNAAERVGKDAVEEYGKRIRAIIKRLGLD